jgi:ABC-2 type transport system ATP-binding protein
MSEAIYVKGLSKAYNGKTVLDKLDLGAKSGTVFGLLGANGAVQPARGQILPVEIKSH